jgi:hypothetical protein
VAAEDISTDEHAGAAPVACTLTSAGLAAQAGRWQQLAARAMTARTETAHGLRISFRAVAGAEEELRDLVAVENECCPWADWAVKPDQGQLVLEVRSTGTGIATLHTMFTSLQPATAPRA